MNACVPWSSMPSEPSPRSGRSLTPTPPDSGVVVRVMATGLCRSDWHAWAGHDDIAFPARPGARARRRRLRGRRGRARGGSVGDRVTVPFVCGCGRASGACAGRRPGVPRPAAARLHPLGLVRRVRGAARRRHQPRAASPTTSTSRPRRASAAGSPRPTAPWSAAPASPTASGSRWSAPGGVGLSAVMIARALGARVVAVDRNPEALAVASTLGAEHTLLARRHRHPGRRGRAHRRWQPRRRRRRRQRADLCGRRSSACAVVAATSRSGCSRPSSGHPRVPMARVIAWELDLLGSHGMAAADYPGMMALIEQGRLQPRPSRRADHRSRRGGGGCSRCSTGPSWPA